MTSIEPLFMSEPAVVSGSVFTHSKNINLNVKSYLLILKHQMLLNMKHYALFAKAEVMQDLSLKQQHHI